MEPLTPEEVRVVGCLVEKQMTTPDSYPLTHNALRAACNQLSNRHPVVSYDDSTVMRALASLRAKQLARVVHIPGSRVAKHRHVLDEALELDPADVALLGVLALRGPQTVGELRTRTERIHPFAGLTDVEETLERLAARPEPLVVRLERQPGQKESRYAHLLSGPVAPEAAAGGEPAPGGWAPETPAPSAGGVDRSAGGVDRSVGGVDRSVGGVDRSAGGVDRSAGGVDRSVGGEDRSVGGVDRSVGGEDRLAALEALEARVAAVEAGLAALRRDLGIGGGPGDEPAHEA